MSRERSSPSRETGERHIFVLTLLHKFHFKKIVRVLNGCFTIVAQAKISTCLTFVPYSSDRLSIAAFAFSVLVHKRTRDREQFNWVLRVQLVLQTGEQYLDSFINLVSYPFIHEVLHSVEFMKMSFFMRA